jgi:hypothetical protein
MLYFPAMEDASKSRMDKTAVKVFSSFQEAEAADKEYYQSLTPGQRVQILLLLREQYSPYDDELTKGFKRVCRVIERS